MNRTNLRRRRVLPRIDVEALESRYVLNSSFATVELAQPNFGPVRTEAFQFVTETVTSVQAHPIAVESALPPALPVAPVSPAPIESHIEIDIFRFEPFEPRDPFGGGQMGFIEAFSFQSYTQISNRPTESSPEEASSLASPNPTHSSGSNATGPNAPSPEQSSSTDAVRAEEAAAFVNSNRADGAVVAAVIAARHTDTFGSAGLPPSRVLDRPAPTAFATSLAADAVRPHDANVPDASRPLPSPADLSMPRITPPAAEPQEVNESSSQSPPVEQARDAVFSGLFVDGFAPRLLDHAFQAMKAVEANLESPDGSRWYRLALGCWVVAAALAYEAGRQSQNSTARSLRYATATLRDPDPEDDR